MRLQPSHFERIVVGDDVWIGSAAVVSAGVADHTIVAAGAVVTERFEEWRILGGVPAKPIGVRP
jgi:maltose O-acetyltransferase